jgi:hypothetical protein
MVPVESISEYGKEEIQEGQSENESESETHLYSVSVVKAESITISPFKNGWYL